MTLILTKAELERIRAEAHLGESAQSTAENLRKAELKRKSAERVKNWPNTLEALRLKKESAAKEREAEEELRRQEQDRQEAEMRKQQRLESIRKANDLLYEQTDKMKLLRTQTRYADVIHHRVSQVDDKRKVKEQNKEYEAHYHEETMRQVQRAEEIERQKEEKQKRLIEDIKIVRTQQREEARNNREEITRKNREEGLKMKEDAKRRAEEELREYEEKMRLAAGNNSRMIKANEDLKAIRVQMREQEALAEAERDKEVEKIDYRKRMLKHLEKVRFDKAQTTRQKIIDAAVEQLAKKSSTEQAILEKQVKDLQEREDRLLAEKARIQEKQKRDILEQREQQTAARDAALRRQHDEDMAMLDRQRRDNEEAMAREKAKMAKTRADTIEFKNQQFAEARERARKKEEERIAEIEQARFLQSIDNGDDTRFIELCKAEIEKNIKAGKPIYTLLRALEYSQPALIPAKVVKKDGKEHK